MQFAFLRKLDGNGTLSKYFDFMDIRTEYPHLFFVGECTVNSPFPSSFSSLPHLRPAKVLLCLGGGAVLDTETPAASVVPEHPRLGQQRRDPLFKELSQKDPSYKYTIGNVNFLFLGDCPKPMSSILGSVDCEGIMLGLSLGPLAWDFRLLFKGLKFKYRERQL